MNNASSLLKDILQQISQTVSTSELIAFDTSTTESYMFINSEITMQKLNNTSEKIILVYSCKTLDIQARIQYSNKSLDFIEIGVVPFVKIFYSKVANDTSIFVKVRNFNVPFTGTSQYDLCIITTDLIEDDLLLKTPEFNFHLLNGGAFKLMDAVLHILSLQNKNRTKNCNTLKEVLIQLRSDATNKTTNTNKWTGAVKRTNKVRTTKKRR